MVYVYQEGRVWKFMLFPFWTLTQSRTTCRQFWKRIIFKIQETKIKASSSGWGIKGNVEQSNQGEVCTTSFILELSGLFCKACNTSTQCEEKMRTVAPVFWHCNSTEGRRQSQHDNSAVELDVFGTPVPGFIILKTFYSFPHYFSPSLQKGNEQQRTIFNSNTKYFLLY